MSHQENTPAAVNRPGRFPRLTALEFMGYLVLIAVAVVVRVNEWSPWALVPLALAVILWRPTCRRLLASR